VSWYIPSGEGRTQSQSGQNGKSNLRWIVGGQRRFVLKKLGLLTRWDWATANSS